MPVCACARILLYYVLLFYIKAWLNIQYSIKRNSSWKVPLPYLETPEFSTLSLYNTPLARSTQVKKGNIEIVEAEGGLTR